MPILKNVLGLDLGSHSVKAVQLQQGLRRLEASHVHGAMRDGSPLADTVRALVEIHRLDPEHVVTAVRGDRVSVRRLAFPFTERRRLAQAVPFEVEDTLPFDLEEVVADWEVAARERNRVEVMAAVAPRAEVSDLIECLHEAGCDPRVVECEGLVLANLAAAFDLPGSRVLADIGHTKTTLCALQEGRPLAARAFGAAGLTLTEAIAQDRGLAFEEAERAKCEEGVRGSAPGSKLGAELDQIAGEIVRLVAALEPLWGDADPEVTLLGGGAQLDRIDEFLAERTGLATARIGLPRPEAGLGLVAGGSPVLFAPTIALALRGTARSVTDVNFRQDEFARRVDLSRYVRDFGFTGKLAAAVAAMGVVWFLTDVVLESRRARQIESRIEALYAEALPGAPIPADPLKALRTAVSEENERADFLGVYRGNLSALDLLTEISRLVPANLEVVFEELSIDRQTIRIRVFAKSFESADRLRAELAEFRPFAEARIGAIETDKRTGGKKFNVTVSLAPVGERG